MKLNRFKPRLALGLLCLFAVFTLLTTFSCRADDISSSYQWKPVSIGGGGWVVGMVLHPLDATVRYARTDVGNGYRWDDATQQWRPMRVRNADGSGVQSTTETSAPSGYGVESIAVDPINRSVVYMVFPTAHSCDVQCSSGFLQIYRSADGGINFTPGGMLSAAIRGNPNGAHRWAGERLAIDPANSAVMYYASESQGVFQSNDGGASWTQLSGTASPPADVEFVNVQFARRSGLVSVGGGVVTKTIFAVSVKNNADSGGDVFESSDGGQTWTDISALVVDPVSQQSLAHQALSSSIDSDDRLYVAENSETNGRHRACWRYSHGLWNRISLEQGGVNLINQAVVSVVADPANPQRVYALGADTSLSRSDDNGATWTNLGPPRFGNTLAWLPQTVGMSGGQWHSNGGLKVDASGNLWTPTGQEGPLTISASAAAATTAANPPQWSIVTAGIEELVSQDIVVPPGSSDTVIATAGDTTGFVITDPDVFSAVQIPLQQEIIAQGTSVDFVPDVPSYIAVTSSNVYTNGPNYSGYSADGGLTWKKFGSAPQYNCAGSRCDIPAGIVAVSVRGNRTLGSDHIVLYPPKGFAPQYSWDGGATWHVTASFPLNADGLTIDTAGFNSFAFPQLSQHLLRADPFIANKFYLKFTHAPDSLYISSDGGKTWQGQPAANLPDYAWHGQLVINRFVKDDLWFADGWEGSTAHGLFHSLDGGKTFQQIPGIRHAITLAVGGPRGQAGDAAYSIYFYGLLASDAQWGVFRSTNGGASWDRVAYYPTGIYDRPTTMAASADTFGKIYIGFSGNSFVYGQPATPVPPTLPAAPTALNAIAVSDTEIDLSWMGPAGTSYNVFRGTASQAQSATPIATGLAKSSYADISVTKGTTYFYKVAAVNSAGQGALSSEAHAKSLQPAINLAPATGSSTSATIAQGQTATFRLVVNSVNYAGVISFSCAGAPAGYTCVAPSPATIDTSTTTTAISVSVKPIGSAGNFRHSSSRFPLALGLLLVPIFLRRKRLPTIFALLLAMLTISVTACGSGGGAARGDVPVAPAPVSSTLTLTAQGTGVVAATQSLVLTIR